MKIIVTITNELGGQWGADDCANDAELIDLICEDIYEFINGATWRVKRIPDGETE